MAGWQKVLKTAYLDCRIDAELKARAQTEGVGRHELMVAYIEEGLCEVPPNLSTEGEAAPEAPPGQKTARILRNVYLDQALSMALSSRASGECTPSSRLIERFCAEGLARPPSGGRILRRSQERLVTEHKAKIEDLFRASVEATRRLREARQAFRLACPHLHVSADVSTDRCDDCGASVTRPTP